MRAAVRLPGRVWVLVAGVCVLVLYGIVGYLILGYGGADAVAMTLLALTTVGFTAPSRMSAAGELFTASLAVLGVSVFLAAIGLLGTALVEGRLGAGSRRRRMQKRIDALRDHYIVCAYGRVGRTVARDFEAEGAPYVVVEGNQDVAEALAKDGALYLMGSPSSEAVLRAAGIERARGLVCAVDSDAENVYITIVARSLNPRIAIVARAAEEASADRLYRAGATRVISPYVTSGRRMALLALRPHVVEFFEIARRGGAELRLEELLVTDDSELVGRRLGDVCGSATPVLLRRPDGALQPSPAADTLIAAGDVIVVFGEASALRPMEEG